MQARSPGLLVGVLAAPATTAVTALLRRRPPGGAERWTRTNHAGRPISLLEGPGVVIGSVVGSVVGSVAGSVLGSGHRSHPGTWPAVLAGGGAGIAGLIDDLAGDSASKGLRGHLGALREGRVTTGAVKILLIGATGLAAAAIQDRGQGRRLGPSTLIGGAVIAGSANLGNLLDLRPGRAGKVTVVAGIPLLLAGEPAAGAAVGAALGALPQDLAGATMLGDTGANALGALIGTALIGRTGLPGRAGALAALVGLTLLSERVSFTRIIETTPGLREFDAWGRG